MRRLKRFFHKILVWAGIRRRGMPEDMPYILDKETLTLVLAEVRGLRRHAVDVRELQPGEEPGPPRPASDRLPPGYQ